MKTILLLLLSSLLLCLSSFAQAEKYALLVSSGPSPSMNFTDYAFESREMWLSLLDSGYKKENILILDGANGSNNIPYYSKTAGPTLYDKWGTPYYLNPPERDNIFLLRTHYTLKYNPVLVDGYGKSDGYSRTPHDWDRDGSSDLYGGATWANFENACNQLASMVTEEDELFVYFRDHGSNFENGIGFKYWFWDDGDWDVNILSMPSWIGGEDPSTGDLMNIALSQISYNKRIIYTSTCFAGAIKNHITGDNTIFLCNTSEDNFSLQLPITRYVGGPRDGEVDWGGSFGHATAIGIGTREADYNMDGKISWTEVFDYSYNNDPYGPVINTYIDIPGFDHNTPVLFDDDNIADTTYVIEAIEGDVNIDGKVNMLDKVLVYNNLGMTEATWWDGDFNGDGEVTQEDLDSVLANWDPDLVGIDWIARQSNLYEEDLLGDIDGDNFVGGDDLNLVLANWGQSSEFSLLAGDIDYDGFVGGEDLNLLLINWGQGVNPSVLVPEPSVCILIGIGFASFVCKRKKRK